MMAMMFVWLLVLLILGGGVVVFVVGALVAFFNSRNEPMARGPQAGHSQTPLGIAAERYARGEIDRDQYEQLKRDLTT